MLGVERALALVAVDSRDITTLPCELPYAGSHPPSQQTPALSPRSLASATPTAFCRPRPSGRRGDTATRGQRPEVCLGLLQHRVRLLTLRNTVELLRQRSPPRHLAKRQRCSHSRVRRSGAAYGLRSGVTSRPTRYQRHARCRCGCTARGTGFVRPTPHRRRRGWCTRGGNKTHLGSPPGAAGF